MWLTDTSITAKVVTELTEASYGSLYVERGIAQAALESLRRGLQIQFVGDSRILIDCLLGHSCAKDPAISRSVKMAHTALQTLIQHFCIKPPPMQELAQHVPRSDNAAADATANWALDNKSFMEVRVPEVLAFLEALAGSDDHSIGLLFSFDGAARGNPGPASSGVCAWWGHFMNGAFESKGLLLQKGTRLGTGTNNFSEAHGLATALKTSLHYYLWVIEQTSKLALHSVRSG